MEEVMLSKQLVMPSLIDQEGKRQKSCLTRKGFVNARDNKLVCVTSGNSCLGSSVVKELLSNGYFVRVTVQNPADFEDMKLHMKDEELQKLESVVVMKMQDLDSLCEVFRGCHAVFHTASFIDPHGVSGYSEKMAFLETEAAKNVIEACGRAAYVRRCIFTSSLLASIWTNDSSNRVIDENCWSSEAFCRENKLWLALGKTSSEKEAWRKSKEFKVNLVTICPALLTDPTSSLHHLTDISPPYLKGGLDMLQRGVLAIAGIKEVAEAHVRVYEAMDHGACGRYLCYKRALKSVEEAIQLENELKINGLFSRTRNGVVSEEISSNLTKSRLDKLLSQATRGLSCKQQ